MNKKKAFFFLTIPFLFNIVPLPIYAEEIMISNDIEQKMLDIILSIDDEDVSSIDVNNIKNGIKYALEEMGINSNSINFSDFSIEDSYNLSDIIWNTEFMNYNRGTTKFNVDGIGNLAISNEGNTVCMLGNQVLAGKNAIYTMPKEDAEQKFSYEYEIAFGDSFNAGGILLRIERFNDTLVGYMISINNSLWQKYTGGYTGAIWKFEFQKGTNKIPFTTQNIPGSKIQFIKGLNIANSGTLNITANSKYITVSGGDLSEPVTVQIYYEEDIDNDGKKEVIENKGVGYGFFSDHYEHNCEKIGKFEINNVLITEKSKSYFKNLLNDLTWKNDGSLALIIDLKKYMDTDIENPEELGKMLARCMNEDIHYLSWGPEDKKKSSEAFIIKNDGNGKFIPLEEKNKNYDKCIEQTAQYIKELLDVGTGKSGLPINMDKFIIPQTNNPIAMFDIEKNNENQAKINRYSYAQNGDETNIGFGKGIAEEKWEHKPMDSSEWKNGLPEEDFEKGHVRLSVKDFKNQWSQPTVRYLDNQPTKPIAEFNNNNNSSYSPNGNKIERYDWEIKKDGVKIGEWTSKNSDIPKFLEKGKYTYSLQVTDSKGNISDVLTRNIINEKPENKIETLKKEFSKLPKKAKILLASIWIGVFILSLILGFEIITYFLI